MIEGVILKPLVRHSDDRGYFQEILRNDDDILSKFGQMSFSKTYPNVIKAFHYHKKQDDVWFFPVGNAQVVLYDTREDSPTFRKTNTFYLGQDNPQIILIPIGVAHGYKVLGNTPAIIIYLTTESYDSESPDEYRIDYDDLYIEYDWETKNR
jgi:dTDP-4-dehydrorhamnose 3,5-epimerase